jgi:hypothetical protein
MAGPARERRDPAIQQPVPAFWIAGSRPAMREKVAGAIGNAPQNPDSIADERESSPHRHAARLLEPRKRGVERAALAHKGADQHDILCRPKTPSADPPGGEWRWPYGGLEC